MTDIRGICTREYTAFYGPTLSRSNLMYEIFTLKHRACQVRCILIGSTIWAQVSKGCNTNEKKHRENNVYVAQAEYLNIKLNCQIKHCCLNVP